VLDVVCDIIIIVSVVIAANLVSWIVDRTWHPSKRRIHNDLIAWQVGTLGTIYAVIIGFMLLTVWTKYDAAQANADLEANTLVSINRIAVNLSPSQKDEIQKAAREYVDFMIRREWPDMEHRQAAHDSDRLMRRLNKAILAGKPSDPAQNVLLDHAVTELSTMTECRRMRQTQCNAELPVVLWFILVLGGTVTILISCLLGTESKCLHVLLISALSFMITLSIVAIADINQPFQGATHVAPTGFIRASQTLQEENGS